MMAPHRPGETPSDQPPPPPIDLSPPPPPPASPGTLPASNFLVGFDWVLALLTVVLGFLIAFFAIRNSEFWVHLATGRLVAEGNYSFGKDPFSYVGGDRTWVNHSWLFDLGLYLMHQVGGGPAIVILKGIAVAALAGFLMLARKPGQPVFPSILCSGLALLAIAPRLVLQPAIASYLAMAVLMFLLIRFPKPAGSWRFPVMIGILFWFWANFDQWFILGPVVLTLYTGGQYVRRDPEDDPLTLWKALGIGVIACMLNPHHVRVWEIPIELIDRELAAIYDKDGDFAFLFAGTFDSRGWDFSGKRDNPLNIYSAIALAAAALAGVAWNRKQASVGLVVVWVATGILAVYHVRAVPFFAVVSAAVAGVNLAEMGRQLTLRNLPSQTLRILHAFRGGGRALVVVAWLVLIAVSYAGWLHPMQQQRRWGWDIEPNESMKRAALQIRTWRQPDDRGNVLLPAEARMLNLQPDFASYVAWFAPGEKTYCDYRIRFHRPEARDYVAIRRHLSLRTAQERKQDPFDVPGFLRRNQVSFVVNSAPTPRVNRAILTTLLGDVVNPEWTLWQVSGQTTILGWNRQEVIPSTVLQRLRFDPLRAAFTDVELLPGPPSPLRPPLPLLDEWDHYITAPPASPVNAEETLILMVYRDKLVDWARVRQGVLFQRMGMLTTVDRYLSPAFSYWTRFLYEHQGALPIPMPRDATAVELLAIRSSRRAIAASPDHPDGYYFLAKSYNDSSLPVSGDIKAIVSTVNLARCRARLPDDPVQARYAYYAVDLFDSLFQAHLSVVPPRLDLGGDMIRLGIAYRQTLIDEREMNLVNLQGDERSQEEKALESQRRTLSEQEKRLRDWENELKKRADQYVNDAARLTSPLERAAVARRLGLTREAIAELQKSHETFQKQLEAEGDTRKYSNAELASYLAVHSELIELLMFDGRIEEASAILDAIDTPDNLNMMTTNAGLRDEYFQLRQKAMRFLFPDPRQRPQSRFDRDPAAHYRNLREALSLCLGDFRRAADAQLAELQVIRLEVEQMRQRQFPKEAPKTSELIPVAELLKELVYRPWLGPITVARMDRVSQVQQYLGLVQARLDTHFRIAMTYLEQGDIDLAVHHFRQTLDASDWSEPLPIQRAAKEFVDAIAVARSKETRP